LAKESMRRFAGEVMPHFAGDDEVVVTDVAAVAT
jgi:hypothetical protein